MPLPALGDIIHIGDRRILTRPSFVFVTCSCLHLLRQRGRPTNRAACHDSSRCSLRSTSFLEKIFALTCTTFLGWMRRGRWIWGNVSSPLLILSRTWRSFATARHFGEDSPWFELDKLRSGRDYMKKMTIWERWLGLLYGIVMLLFKGEVSWARRGPSFIKFIYEHVFHEKIISLYFFDKSVTLCLFLSLIQWHFASSMRCFLTLCMARLKCY